MDYISFVTYTVIMGMISLPRNELREKIIKGAEIQEVLHGQPKIKGFLMSLYECKYAEFFKYLSEIETVSLSDYYYCIIAKYRFLVIVSTIVILIAKKCFLT